MKPPPRPMEQPLNNKLARHAIAALNRYLDADMDEARRDALRSASFFMDRLKANHEGDLP